MTAAELTAIAAGTDLHPTEVSLALERLRGDNHLKRILSCIVQSQADEHIAKLKTVKKDELEKIQGIVLGLETAKELINPNR